MYSSPRRTFIIRRATLTLLFLTCLPLLARAERLPLKIYTVADGLASNEINKIVTDSRGFVWFCTSDGLSRFDDYVFTNYGSFLPISSFSLLMFLPTV